MNATAQVSEVDAGSAERTALTAFLAACMDIRMDGQHMADAMIDILKRGGHIKASSLTAANKE